jgi:hypothetical protein
VKCVLKTEEIKDEGLKEVAPTILRVREHDARQQARKKR